LTAILDLQANLDPAVKTNDLVKLRSLLKAASLFGIGEAYPVPEDAGLLAQAQIAQLEVDRRVKLASVPGADPSTIATAVFGQGFLLLEPFEPPFSAELDLALNLGKTPPFGATPSAIRKWLQQAARARPALSLWRKLGMYATALGRTPPLDFEVAQLPFDASAAWVALPFATEKQRPSSGHLSLALHRPAKPPVTASWFGLFLDDWTETIPKIKETTSIAFHYDDPGAEAPQAVLLAVPPTRAENWDIETFAAILNETVDLAHIRAVDLELLGEFGQLIPAIYLPTDEANNTISSNFATSVVSHNQRISRLGVA
jgi:hypothetical protein